MGPRPKPDEASPLTINRHIWDESELEEVINGSNLTQQKIFMEIRRLLAIRRRQTAFHPNATQYTLHLGDSIFAFWRQSISRDQSIFCISNISSQFQMVNLRDINLINTDDWRDLISGRIFSNICDVLKLQPYQVLWISN